MARKDGFDAEYAKEVGARITKARLELGMTQEELADLLHLSERSVFSHETGKVIPYRQMSEYAEILKVTKRWLLHGDTGPLEAGDVARRLDMLVETNQKILVELQHLKETPSPDPSPQ